MWRIPIWNRGVSEPVEDGSEQPIAFASRTLSAADTGDAQIEREALALTFGVQHFHN